MHIGKNIQNIQPVPAAKSLEENKLQNKESNLTNKRYEDKKKNDDEDNSDEAPLSAGLDYTAEEVTVTSASAFTDDLLSSHSDPNVTIEDENTNNFEDISTPLLRLYLL